MLNTSEPIITSGKKCKSLLNSCIVLLLITSTATAIAANEEFSITDAQTVEVVKQEQSENDSQTRMSFYAFGQTFNLLLQKNEALINNYSSRLIDIELYAGTIEGVDGSWARISEVNGEFSGAIYDGYELFMLDSGKMIAESVDTRLKQTMQSTDNVVYRASDMSSTMSCGGSHGKDHEMSKFSYDGLVSELQQRQQAQQTSASGQSGDFNTAVATATQQVNLSIVADTQYVATSPNGAEAQVLSQMNIVDGIFSEQVGVQFGITEIQVLSNNGPLTSTNSSTLLNQYRGFVGNNNPGLSHLFTGRNVDGNVIGIAFISAICTSNGVGVTQAGGRGTLGALTAAHEFGHNFGSPHDNQAGSACAATPGNFLMNPSINGSNQFSQCSLEQISNVLSVRNSCLVEVNEPAPPTPIADCNAVTNFANGAAGFVFVDDPQSPAYTAGSASSGSLNVTVGAVDNADISDIEGAWRRQCQSDNTGQVTIRVNGGLTQASEYEANEFSQLILRVNGNLTVLAELTGDGNGGPTQSTGIQEFTATATLSAGVNTIDLLCFNNLKTFNNEVTNCSFNEIAVAADNIPTPEGDLINSNFDADFGGFTFEDDASDPLYANGDRTATAGVDSSGALFTVLGGVDDVDITNMQANWTQDFTTQGGSKTLTLDARLVQTADYEADENSEVAIIIDGQILILNRVVGNGNGGDLVGTGFQRYSVALNLNAGSHKISLVCRNNKKTFNNESTACVFDNVLIQ